MRRIRRLTGRSSGRSPEPHRALETVPEETALVHTTSAERRIRAITRTPPGRKRSSPSNGKRVRPNRFLQAVYLNPRVLVSNDLYLNDLFTEIWHLYQPGALTGSPIRSVNHLTERHLSLLRQLAPGYTVRPLLPYRRRNSPSSNKTSPSSRKASQLLHGESPSHQTFSSSSGGSHGRRQYLHPDDARTMGPKRKAVASASTKASSKRAAGGRKDLYNDPDHLLSAKSKLVGVDLCDFFANPLAWSSLTEEQQTHLRSLLPPDIEYDESGAPSQSYLRYDNDWREQLRVFSEDLEAGRYEPEWQAEAQAASEERRRGDFDEWKEKEFELWWGQKSDAHADLMAGQALRIRFPEMIGSGVFEVGDIFVYVRAFTGDNGAFIVEKEAQIVEVTAKTLSFAIPCGTARLFKPASPSPSLLQVRVPSIYHRETGHSSTSAEPESVKPNLTIPSGSSRRGRTPTPDAAESRAPTAGVPLSKAPVLSRPGTSDSKRSGSSGGGKLGNPPFGIFGSVRRRRSMNQGGATFEKAIDVKEKARRTPSPAMAIAPILKGPDSNADTESDLSELSDLSSDFDDNAPPPWLMESTSREGMSSASKGPGPVAKTDEKKIPRRPLSRPSASDDSASGKEAPGILARQSSLPPGSNPASAANKFVDASHAQSAYTSTDECITVHGIDSPNTLEQKIVEIDGRHKGDVRGNGWRLFHCRRNGAELGTLWKMREEYYEARHG